MPLPPPVPREFLTRRTVTCEGYSRADGLMDIEGHLVDVRDYDMNNEWRGCLKAGDAAHDMWVRLTIDEQLTIVEAVSSTDGAPYPTCRDITPHTQRLVGLKIVGGFKREMRARIGNTEGCTHIVALMDELASVAIQTLAGSRRDRGTREQLSTFNVRDPSRPALLDTCHSYAADSPIIARLWPMHYRPPK
jgi:hypothetical protein